jgi:microcystin-dependent protein
MAQPYVGEIRIFAGNFAPAGWMFCQGQQLPISENDVLFQLIGTTYGGDGQSTFALPDLTGRLPIHQGNSFQLGQAAGVTEVVLTTQQMPVHSHTLLATASTATTTSPADQVLAASTGATVSPYGTDAPLTSLSAQAVSAVGGSAAHTNLQPYLCLNFIISLFGLYPSPT